MKKLYCPKCNRESGDDWTQCKNDCPMSMSPHHVEKIHQVAILGEGDIIWTLRRPKRHSDVIKHMVDEGEPTPITGEQGFVTTRGRFVNRRQAAAIALMTGQIKELKYQPDILFSEDLW